jgi:hypothetical protein
MGRKGTPLLANPTNSQPSDAHDSTTTVLELEFVRMANPSMGSPSLAVVASRSTRIDMGDLLVAFADDAPPTIKRMMSPDAAMNRLLFTSEE